MKTFEIKLCQGMILLMLLVTVFASRASSPGCLVSFDSARLDVCSGSVSLVNGDLRHLADVQAFAGSHVRVVKFGGPVTAGQRAALQALDAEILGYVPYYGYKVRMAPSLDRQVRDIPGVVWTGPYLPAWKIEVNLANELLDGRILDVAGGELDSLLVGLHRGIAADAARGTLAATEGLSYRFQGRSYDHDFLVLRFERARLGEIVEAVAAIEAVNTVGFHWPVRPMNSQAGWLHQGGLDAQPDQMPVFERGIFGCGQVGGVLDSGLHVQHCSFSDPLFGEPAWTACGDGADCPATGADFGHRKIAVHYKWADISEGVPELSASGPGDPPEDTMGLMLTVPTAEPDPPPKGDPFSGKPVRRAIDDALQLDDQGCSPYSPAYFAGAVALILRGDSDLGLPCPFALKVQNAQAAGADMIVIRNDEPGPLSGWLVGATPEVPVYGMAMDDGENLAEFIGKHVGEATVDFDFRIVEEPADLHGHGTHVTGSMLGNNPADAVDCENFTTPGGVTDLDGTAPGAKLVSQEMGPSLDYLNFLGGTLYHAGKIAYDHGARSHNNSWGAGCALIGVGDCIPGCEIPYNSLSRDGDALMWDFPDLLVFLAAGNQSGGDGDPGNCGPGQAVGLPGNAKSVFTIGSTQRGASADNMSGFSSRGPTGDRRTKPEITAQGSDIQSASLDECGARSSSGTSMASPTAAGLALLVREYLQRGFYPSGGANAVDAITTPSAALVKAIMINGAEQMTGLLGSGGDTPNQSQGWGRILLNNSLYFEGDERRLWLFDGTGGLQTGSEEVHAITVNAGQPLVVTLVWSDFPAEVGANPAIVNMLRLEVETPEGEVWTQKLEPEAAVPILDNPNPFQDTTDADHDDRNTVHQIKLDEPAAGEYQFRVKGIQVAMGDAQPYALAVTGDIEIPEVEEPADEVFEDRFEVVD